VRKQAVQYWNRIASTSEAEARDAVLCGFRSERAFDDAGREDASHLLLPFVAPTDTVLDVGCGLGRLLRWVAPACRRAIGVDVSKEMLAKARARVKGLRNVELKRVPVSLRIPVPDKSIDFAYFYHVSEHLDREDTYKILREIRRCLQPRGRALVQFSLLDHPDNQREFRTWAREGDEEGVRSRFYSETEVGTLLGMVALFPQIRLYIPGEFVVVVTRRDSRVLGQMPLVRLPHAQRESARSDRPAPGNNRPHRPAPARRR